MTDRGRLVVVRPEPGNGRTAVAARARGWTVDPMPLFAVVPLAWAPPDACAFDAVMLTSANAARHGGSGLAALRLLPCVAVGEATAATARRAGLTVVLTGTRDAAALVVEAAALGLRRLLHLGGRDRIALAGVTAIDVYASEALPPPVDAAVRLRGATVLLHSARAARAVATLVPDRATTALAAIGAPVLAAAGEGWRGGIVAAAPTDAALLAAAERLAD